MLNRSHHIAVANQLAVKHTDTQSCSAVTVAGYLMGVPVTSYSVGIGQEHVEFAGAHSSSSRMVAGSCRCCQHSQWTW